jgi:CheY-like chemotaxis protein
MERMESWTGASGKPAPQDESGDVAEAVEGLRVLVVDDNEDSALSLAMLLELQGYAVTTSFRAADALERARERRPNVALLDIGLPDMSGYELAARLRESLAPSPVTLVALTGWGQDEDRRAAEDAGFDHHFTKPVDPDALEHLLRELGRA